MSCEMNVPRGISGNEISSVCSIPRRVLFARASDKSLREHAIHNFISLSLSLFFFREPVINISDNGSRES